MTDVPVEGTATEPSVQWITPPPLDQVTETANSPRVRLWLPREMAIASALLGFPGGFGVAARNAWRLGRRATAYLLLLAGAAIMGLLVFALPEDTPRALVYGLNLGVVAGLFAIMRRQITTFERGGGAVERASGAAGLATFLGGWVVTVSPSVLLIFVLTFLGGQVQAILAGTVEFGTAGVGCEVEARATSISRTDPVHYAAHLSRDVNVGETLHFSLRQSTGIELFKDDLTADTVADCMSGTIPAFTLSTGSYVFEFTTGAERLALGEITISAP